MIDSVAEILSTERRKGMILTFALSATDDGSLERLLLTSIRNRLIDEAKGTPVGKLRRWVQTLLGNDASSSPMPRRPPRVALMSPPLGVLPKP